MPVILDIWEAEIQKLSNEASPGKQLVRPSPLPHIQNNQSKMEWRCGSRGKIPALSSNPSSTYQEKNLYGLEVWLKW
jgi:hypothetical protein